MRAEYRSKDFEKANDSYALKADFDKVRVGSADVMRRNLFM